MPDDNNPSSSSPADSHTIPSTSFDCSRLPASPPTDNRPRAHLSHQILNHPRNSLLDPLVGFPTSPSLPQAPHPEEPDGPCLYRPSHPHNRDRNGGITVSSIGSSSTERTTSDAGSRWSSVTSFSEGIMHLFWRSSPSPSRETDTGSDLTQNSGQKGDVKSQGAEPARHGSAMNESPILLPRPSEFTDSTCLSSHSTPPFNAK